MNHCKIFSFVNNGFEMNATNKVGINITLASLQVNTITAMSADHLLAIDINHHCWYLNAIIHIKIVLPYQMCWEAKMLEMYRYDNVSSV